MIHFLPPGCLSTVSACELAIAKLAAEINPHLVAGQRCFAKVPIGLGAQIGRDLRAVGWTVEIALMDQSNVELRLSLPPEREQTIEKFAPASPSTPTEEKEVSP